MKRLLITAALVLWAAPSHAETCEGRIKRITTTSKEELYPLGTRLLVVGTCGAVGSKAAEQHILRFCPVGTYCHIAFTSEGDGEISAVDAVVPLRGSR